MPYLDDHHYLYPRDAAAQLTPNDTQRTTLIVAGCYIIVIAILWHVPILSYIIYPFKLLTVGFHEMSHAIAGILTCATIHSVELDPDEGGETRMSGGIPWITLPAGYLGSSLIGACLIACGFDTNASKIACIVLGVFFLFTLWWARRNWLCVMYCLCIPVRPAPTSFPLSSSRTWALILGMTGLVILFWFVAESVCLRYFILFVGVMSDLYVLWDVIDDTIARKVNNSDASAFARICGCFPSQVWGVIWLLVAFGFFVAGVLVGIVAFKESATQQQQDANHFLPAPGSSAAVPGATVPTFLIVTITSLVWNLLA
ncbi:peptidase M50B-like-domain-containing protein [Chiua virens]|nr:peptidase M50B-like-domain-containing protein [Chiua virens]